MSYFLLHSPDSSHSILLPIILHLILTSFLLCFCATSSPPVILCTFRCPIYISFISYHFISYLSLYTISSHPARFHLFLSYFFSSWHSLKDVHLLICLQWECTAWIFQLFHNACMQEGRVCLKKSVSSWLPSLQKEEESEEGAEHDMEEDEDQTKVCLLSKGGVEMRWRQHISWPLGWTLFDCIEGSRVLWL